MPTNTKPFSLNASLLHLLQLASPTLPVGAYAYSQGLEYAIDQKWVVDPQSTRDWIQGIMENSMSRVDLPIFLRLFCAAETQQMDKFEFWNQYLFASRESSELQNEDMHIGNALLQLLSDLDIEEATSLIDQSYTYAAAFALASSHWKIQLNDAMPAFLWTWLDNQVASAIKLVPLGQTAGQRILVHCMNLIPAIVQQSIEINDDEIGFSSVALAIGSAHHEQQYSRLFRS